MKMYLGFTGGTQIGSRLIQRLDSELIDGKRYPSLINHVLLHFVPDDGPDYIFQSFLNKGVHITLFSDIQKAVKAGRVIRYAEKRLTVLDHHWNFIFERMKKMEGRSYDARLIILYYLWIRLSHRRADWILKLNRKKSYTCNELVMKTTSCLAYPMPLAYDPQYTPARLFELVFGVPSRVWFYDNPPVSWDD